MTTGTDWNRLVPGTTRRRLEPGSPHRGRNRFQSVRRLPVAVPRSVATVIRDAPPAIAGDGGHNTTFAVACSLWRSLGDRSAVWAALLEYNATKCAPPWSERELRHKLDDTELVARGEGGGRRRFSPTRPSVIAMREVLATPSKRRPRAGGLSTGAASAAPPQSITASEPPSSTISGASFKGRCSCCGGEDFWDSEHRVGICRRCHPPAPGAARRTK